MGVAGSTGKFPTRRSAGTSADNDDVLKKLGSMDLKNIFNVGYQGFPDGTVNFLSN
jgi:hypothetical protein